MDYDIKIASALPSPSNSWFKIDKHNKNEPWPANKK